MHSTESPPTQKFKVTNIMGAVLDCVLCLLNTKMVLIICYEYCYRMINFNADNGNQI